MKTFQDKKTERLFVFLSNSFKTLTGRNRFSDAVRLAFKEKVASDQELVSYQLEAKEVEAIYEETKKLYV